MRTVGSGANAGGRLPLRLGRVSADANRSLEQMVEDERAISKQRSRLHDRIDFLRGTGVGEPDAEERLAKLVAEEREISARRRELHRLIDARRAELEIAEDGPP